MYLDTIPVELNDLNKKFKNNDIKKVTVIAHTLKTKMGYLGMLECKDYMNYIEKNADKKNEAKDIGQKINKVRLIWDETKNEINTYIETFKKR